MISKSKFLIVDDNHIDRMVAAMVLRQFVKYLDVSEADDGLKALTWLKENKDEVAAGLTILLDIRMPEMDGFEFLEQYENLPEEWKNNIEIIMLSSTIDPRDVQRANDNKNVKLILSKPLSIEGLKQAVG